MKIIDILNKMAEGTLEDGFKFRLFKDIYTYNKETNNICNEYGSIGNIYRLESELIDEVEVIEGVKEIEELSTSQTEYVNLNNERHIEYDVSDKEIIDKINELVRVVNELRKNKNELE